MMLNSMHSTRLKLRQWQDTDFKPFANINADADVMRYFPSLLTEEESNALANKIKGLIDTVGYGFWAVELLETREFIGFVGLNKIHAGSDLANILKMDDSFFEIGWRLAKAHWGNGYATEASTLVLKYAFESLLINRVYAFTAIENLPSQKVMQRLGMVNTGQDFNHPAVADRHKLQRHCLWCIERDELRTCL